MPFLSDAKIFGIKLIGETHLSATHEMNEQLTICHNFGSFASTLWSIGVLVLKFTDGNDTLLERAIQNKYKNNKLYY